jgi:hypothetical protein
VEFLPPSLDLPNHPQTLEPKKQLTADPRIGGGILDLSRSQSGRCPVGGLGGFGNPKFQKDRSESADACLFQSVLPRESSEIQHRLVFKRVQAFESADIVGETNAYLQSFLSCNQFRWNSEIGVGVDAEEIDGAFSGHLNHARQMDFTLFETGSRFGVEADPPFPMKVV